MMVRTIGMMSVALAALTGCSNIMEEDDLRVSAKGRTEAKLSFDLTVPAADVLTRSVDMSDGATVKIESLWIGVFDTKTGEQVGRMAGHIRKASDGNRVTMGNDGSYRIEDIDIYYSDTNPEVYIVGVANYDTYSSTNSKGGHVLARLSGDSGDPVELYKLLGIDDATVREEESAFSRKITWEEFCRISVDVKSADASLDKDGYCPLMTGFFNTSKGVNTTVDRNGETPSNARVSMTRGGVRYGETIQPEGILYLRRLQSEITVNVTTLKPNGGPLYIRSIENVEYKIMNRPLEVYLAEHATDKRGGDINADKAVYLSRTANSADFLEEGYESDTEWRKAVLNDDGTYSFTYQHYENKHWGLDWPLESGERLSQLGKDLDDCGGMTWQELIQYTYDHREFYENWGNIASYAARSAHAIRERKINRAASSEETNTLFRTLSKDARHAFNNNASYILLKADVTMDNGSGNGSGVAKGTAYYTIHEGFTSLSDGSASIPIWDHDKAEQLVRGLNDITEPICDFQTVRNTRYTYNIGLYSMHDLSVQAESSSDYIHDDGYTGEVFSISPMVALKPSGNVRSVDVPLTVDGHGNYDYDNFAEVVFPVTIYRKEDIKNFIRNLKWRIFEITPEGEYNFGTWVPVDGVDEKLGMPINGKIYGPESIPDELKEKFNGLYDQIRVDPGTWISHSANEGEFLLYGPRLTIAEFLAGGADRYIEYESNENPLCYLQLGEYVVDYGDDVTILNGYKRGIVFYTAQMDEDGCEYYTTFGAFQTPVDPRAEVKGFGPLPLQSSSYDNTANDIDFNVYSSVLGMSDVDYIRWWAGAAQYESSEPAFDWTGDLFSGDDVHEPIAYEIKVDDTVTRIERKDFAQYRHVTRTEFKLYPNFSDYYYAYPYDIRKLGMGDHDLVITPIFDEDFVRPVDPIVTRLRILERPYWNFDNITFPQIGSSINYYSYGGMTLVGVPVYNGYAEVDGGYLQGSSSSSNDSGIIRFSIDKHGTFKVTARNRNGSSDASANRERKLRFSVRDGGSVYSAPIYYSVSDDQIVYFNTRDIIDEFGDGPVEVAIHSNWRLQIYEIEFIPDDDQRNGLDSSNFGYTCYWRPEEGSTYYNIHNNNPYNWYFYLVPGMETYFAFTDSNPRAKEYIIGLYESPDSDTALFEYTVTAADCRTWTTDFGTAYFVCPVYLPSDDTSLTRGKTYAVAITPMGDPEKYAPGKPHFLTAYSQDTHEYNEPYIVNVPDLDTLSWWDNTSHNGGYLNPFYNWGNVYFRNMSGVWWEHKGLVLHGGDGSGTYPAEDYVSFYGTGYPAYSGSTPDFGGYLSFKVDRPGKVVIKAANDDLWDGNDDDPCFRLYNSKKGLKPNDYIGVRVFNNKEPVELSMGTGEVDGLTEFIICPQGYVGLYSIQFVPSDNPEDYKPVKDAIDTRESLNDCEFYYTNKLPDGTSIHYDTFSNSSGPNIYVTQYLTSYFGFVDLTPQNHTHYVINVYNYSDWGNYPNPISKKQFEIRPEQCLYYEDIDPSTHFDYSELSDYHNGKIVIFPLDIDDLEEDGKYTITISPMGDESIYKPGKPHAAYIPKKYGGYATLYFNKLDQTDGITWWDGQVSPYYYPFFYNWTGMNTIGAFCEENGLVIHGGGNDGITVNGSRIIFARSGYPMSTIGNCGYISFKTEKPGKIMVKSTYPQNSQTGRYICIYDANKTDEYIDRKRVPHNDNTVWVETRTGAIKGPTEFIICPEQGQTIYAIMFVPTDDESEYTPLQEDPNAID